MIKKILINFFQILILYIIQLNLKLDKFIFLLEMRLSQKVVVVTDKREIYQKFNAVSVLKFCFTKSKYF